MTDGGAAGLSLIGYSSTGCFGSSLPPGRLAGKVPAEQRSHPDDADNRAVAKSSRRGNDVPSAGTPSAHSACVTRAAMPRSAMISTT